MTRIIIVREIRAPAETVFRTVADIREFSKVLPHVVKYEFLTETESGLGTRFRETRLMNGREIETELDVTEFVKNDHVRMVADSHGTVWDTLFHVTESDGQTTLTVTMDARPYKLLPKLMIPMTRGMIEKAVASDMDQVKSFCETSA